MVTTGEKLINMEDSTYEIASKLADDLTVDYLASNIADMMITGSREKAKVIRKLSEDNTAQSNKHVQEYRRDRRAIYSALYDLVEGYHGYKIIEETH